MTKPLSRIDKVVIIVLGIGVLIFGGLSEFRDSAKMDQLIASEAFNRVQLSSLSTTLGSLAAKTGVSPKDNAADIARAAAAKIDQLGTQVADLQTRLTKLQEHRHLTDGEKKAMLPILEASPNTFDLSWVNNGEAASYAGEFRDFLLAAKWTRDYIAVLDQRNNPEMVPGVVLGIKDKTNPPQGVFVLFNALKAAGIPYQVYDKSSVDPNSVWIIIGEKR